MKAKIIKLNLIVLLLLLFATVITIFGGVGRAYAAINNYSSVLDDLKKDSNFNFADYPAVNNDYSLKVIQIAESTDGELFIYAYQPAAKTKLLVATDINMSFSESVDETQLFSLSLVSDAGIFQKYRVNSVKVSADDVRYYNISSIYRTWNKEIDGATTTGNIVNKKAYGVGQYWEAKTQDDTVIYKVLKVDTVEIINPFTSYIRRNKNNSANAYYQDNYYVAFSTDRNIDELLSATVEYRVRDYFYKANNVLGFDNTEFSKKATFSNEKRTQKNVYCDEVNELYQQGYKLFGIFDLNDKYSWERIQSSADFIKNAGANSSDKNEVGKLQWVLMFDECSVYRYTNDKLIQTVEETGQIIDEVTILRLEFVEDGVTYNLGAVSDMVSKDHDFSNKTDSNGSFNFFTWLANKLGVPEWAAKAIFFGVIGLIVLAVALPILSAIFPVVGQVLLLALKGLGWIISAPFRFVAWVVRNIKGGD